VRRLMENFGSPKKGDSIKKIYALQKNYVSNVFIESNALNGVLKTNDSVFGVDFPSKKEN